MLTVASDETDPTVIAQAFRTIPAPGALAGNMVALNGSALVPPASLPVGAAATIINGVITASVGSSALTLAVKTLAGADPSTDDPVLVIFRSATTALGTFAARQITAALSIVVPSGATLGHASARDQQIIAYAIDNAGTVELAVATPLFDQSTRLKTTTTIGAGSTSAATIYSTTGRSNVPWAPIARIVSNQTTAGTWANGPSASAPGILQIDMAPFILPTNFVSLNRNGTDQTSLTAGVANKIKFTNAVSDVDSCYDAVTNFRYQPKVPGRYLVVLTILAFANSADSPQAEIFKNGSQAVGGLYIANNCGTGGYIMNVVGTLDMNGTSDYIEFDVYLPTGITSLNGSVANTNATALRLGGL